MRNFFVCSVGELGKDYVKDNLKRIVKDNAFVLHEDTTQKGVYDSIYKGDILLLKYNRQLVAYGECLKRFQSNHREWNLRAKVKEWHFYDQQSAEIGISYHGLQENMLPGSGQMGTVKGVNFSYGINKIEEIDATTDLYNALSIENINRMKSEQIKQILHLKKQIILQGAPGTGKTYATAELALRIINNNNIDSSNRKELMKSYQKAVDEGQIVFTTFHQSLDYEEFIEGIKPIQEGKDITYDIVPGIFKKICKKAIQKDSLKELQAAIEKFKEQCVNVTDDIVLETIEKGKFTVTYRGGITFRVRSLKSQAKEGQDFPASIENIEKLYRGESDGIYNKSYVWGILNHLKKDFQLTDHNLQDNSDKNYVLIIDEINRGNISKIFGELITLLEADKRMGQINEVKCSLPYSNDEFSIPNNLYIIGTMNTTDRSLGHIDYAVRRRFGFISLESKVEHISEYYNGLIENSDDLSESAVKLYNEVKNIVKANTSPEFQCKDVMVGHSYFMASSYDELNLKLEYEIKPLLVEYIKDGILTVRMEEVDNLLDNLKC
ncbi:McrB family protein [Saccharicrinis aurantiacus]|uniref:McrB family protein n=1 Tax=Saccharicrinis aurantiacus TaxID=1849719 RepID=UPI0009F8388C|nr:AAA family ATPase [Saccharicrinis aurantiacus]